MIENPPNPPLKKGEALSPFFEMVGRRILCIRELLQKNQKLKLVVDVIVGWVSLDRIHKVFCISYAVLEFIMSKERCFMTTVFR